MVMNQRTVFIQRDERGFGLRVSGENPVFVESVKPDGAAWKAGIRSGDQIRKVNGRLVTHCNHADVVQLIQKSSDQVCLTLSSSTIQMPNNLSSNLFNPHSSNSLINSDHNSPFANNLPLNLASSTSTRIRPYNSTINSLKDSQRHITPPLPANDSTLIEFEKSRLDTIKKMLGDEREFLQKLRRGEGNPSEIDSTMKRIMTLEEQLNSANETNRQTVARYIIPLDAQFSQLNFKLNSTHSSSRTSSSSSINLQQQNSFNNGKPSTNLSNLNNLNNGNISRKHQSAENLHHYTQSAPNAELVDCQAKKSHSFGQYDHHTTNQAANLNSSNLIAMNSSIDSQLNSSTASKDTNISFYSTSSITNLQSSNKNLQDDTDYDISYLLNCKPNIDLLLEPKNVQLLLNFLHYLLLNKQDINSLLFYILTDLFKKVCENPKFSCLDNSTSYQHHIRKWAFEIYSTFLFNDSPLRLNCDLFKDQTQFYELLNENFTSATVLVNTIFDPYLERSKELINQQIEQFKKHLPLSNGSLNSSNQIFIKKIQPSLIVECLTNDLADLPHQVSLNAFSSSTLLGQITILISFLLNSTPVSNSSIQSIAQLTCFTSILYHCFPHFLVSSDENANTLSKLIPVPVYLSFHQTNTSHSNQLQHKRHKSLPASSNKQRSTVINSSAIPYHLSSFSQPTGNHNNPPVSTHSNHQPKTLAQANNNQIYLKNGHVFSLLNTTKPNNCSACQQSIWAMFGWHCQMCLLTSHHWCLRTSEENQTCPGPIDNVLDNHLDNNDLNQNNLNNLQHLSSTILSSSRSKSKSNIKATGGRLLENILKNRAESLKHKKDDANNKCVSRKKSDPSISSSTLFSDFSSSRPKYLHSPSSSSDSDIDDNQFLNQSENQFNIFNDNIFNRDDQILLNNDNDLKQLSPNSSYLTNLPPRSSSSVQLSAEMKKASKRQDIFKELIATERTHVKNLKILNDIFYRPIFTEQLLGPEQIDYIFSNHLQLYEIHSQIYSLLKQKKKEQQKCIQDQLQYPQQHNPFVILDQGIGQLLAQIFEGDIGKRLEEAASVFCAKQTIGGDILRNKLKKDSKLSAFLVEAEANKCCRRLQLKDMLASCFQRITKYPLLMESLMKEIPDKESEEFQLIERAHKRSKLILHKVNECVKQAENKQKLLDIQRKFNVNECVKQAEQNRVKLQEIQDKVRKEENPLVNFDLTEKTLLYEEGDKYTFKHSNKNTNPILPVTNVMTRPNATDSRGFYLFSNQDNIMYELVAGSEAEKNIWLKQINAAGGVGSSQIKLRDLTSRDEQEQFKDENHEQIMTKLIKDQDLLSRANQQDDDQVSGDQQNEKDNMSLSKEARIDGSISFVKDEDVNLSYNRKYLRFTDQPLTDHAYSSTSRSESMIERVKAIEIEIEKLQNEKKGLLRELNEEGNSFDDFFNSRKF